MLWMSESEVAGEKDTWSIHTAPCQSSALTEDWQVCCYKLAGSLHELTDNVINNLILTFHFVQIAMHKNGFNVFTNKSHLS